MSQCVSQELERKDKVIPPLKCEECEHESKNWDYEENEWSYMCALCEALFLKFVEKVPDNVVQNRTHPRGI